MFTQKYGLQQRDDVCSLLPFVWEISGTSGKIAVMTSSITKQTYKHTNTASGKIAVIMSFIAIQY